MTPATIHPHTDPAWPEKPKLYVKVEAIEGKRPRTEKETAKDWTQVKSLEKLSVEND
jgi:hypothetical protein